MDQSEDAGTGNARRTSKRRTTSRYGTTTVPSAVHYVGYVEEDETPEMIMAKFQELEEIQRQASEREKQQEVEQEQGQEYDASQQLTDDQLLQVFKQTSMFNVKTALQHNAVLAEIDDMLGLTSERYGEDDIVSDDEDMLKSFWSDDEDWDDGVSRRKKKGGRQRVARQRSITAPKIRHRVVTAYNPSTQALVRKKVKIVDPNEIQYIRLPVPPLPLSWGRTIAPYGLEEEPKQEEILHDDAVAEAVLVNAAWYRGYSSEDAIKRISSVSFEKMVPYGFVFVWTPKELIHPVCKLMQKKGYAYIENLTWVWMQPNNTIAEVDSEYIGRSHLTLYMFRAIERSQNIELRHQRSPDVVFDYQKDGHKCPTETYSYLETLLPQSKGKLVELWGNKKENSRHGWRILES